MESGFKIVEIDDFVKDEIIIQVNFYLKKLDLDNFIESNDSKNVDISSIINQIKNQTSSFIDIPFTTPIFCQYLIPSKFTTKNVVDKLILKYFITGKVNYSNSENLIINKIANDHQEFMNVEVDYLERGYLNFTTYNSWLDFINPLFDLIEIVLFGFADNILSIKFSLTVHTQTFMEIQSFELHN